MSALIDQILRPIGHRVGTAIGTFLTANNVAQDDISLLVAAVPVALGVCVDLVIRRVL